MTWLNDLLRARVRPLPDTPLAGLCHDAMRPRSQLILENALLRKQLAILHRQVQRPAFTDADRRWLVILASMIQNWRQTLLIVQPETLLRWHRELFRWFWRRRTRDTSRHPRISPEAIHLIQTMAKHNVLWGAERIRGELLKLNIPVSKRTVQKYMHRPEHKPAWESSQNWKTFVANHADEMWACDFVQTYDLMFRTIFVFFIIEIGSRRVVHCNVTYNPTDQWVSQQLREATPFDESPRFLIRDNDTKFGQQFEMIAKGASIEVLRTPIRAPEANAHCERFIGSFRRECLNHIIALNDRHLQRVTREYVDYFNAARPHQGIQQKIPDEPPDRERPTEGDIASYPVLNGLHHDYRRIA